MMLVCKAIASVLQFLTDKEHNIHLYPFRLTVALEVY